MKKIVLAAALLSTLAFQAARAEDAPDCGNTPKDKWLSQDVLKEKAKAMGLDVRQVKEEGSCYEVYGINAKGEKVEAVFNPATGEQVGTEGAE